MILSILIPVTPERSEMVQPLYAELKRQKEYMHSIHSTLGEIEILVDERERFLDGGPSIGKKREALVKRATGKYCCFVDSDDMIPGNYMESIVRACQYHADIITFKAFARLADYWAIIDMSIRYPPKEATPTGTVQRAPSLVCPVRISLAKQVPFDDTNYGEDSSWMNKILTRCKGEKHIDMILYEYRHGAHSEADNIIKQGYV